MRHVVSTLHRHTDTLRRDRRGGVAMLFAIAGSLVFVSVGAAVDYGTAIRVRGAAESAVDGAALAVAKLVASGVTAQAKLEAEGRTVFDANFADYAAQGYVPYGFTVSAPSSAGTIAVTVDVRVPASFMPLVGVDTMDVSATASAFTGDSAEVVMMLDLTGSMQTLVTDANGQKKAKITILESAAKDAVESLLPSSATPSDKMRIALVPFSASVNAGSLAGAVSQGKATSCVFERSGADAYTDESATLAPLPTGKDCPAKAVVPLTNKRATLLAALRGLPASGGTAGYQGTQWASYMLSPKWKDIVPAASAAKAYDAKTLSKYAVLMTDGQYNMLSGNFYEVYPGDSGRVAAAKKAKLAEIRASTLSVCSAMKANGVTVFTIGFDMAASPDAKDMLESCASEVDGAKAFYDASNGADLRAAYDEIVGRILKIRLAS